MKFGIFSHVPWPEGSSPEVVLEETTKEVQHAEELGFSLISLPSYSPDLNPIEGLWKWMREDLTQHHCYKYLYQLERACFDFIDRINLDPDAIISRLWPKFDLDPSYEKVLFSF